MSPMKFKKYGGNYQLRIETAKDLENIQGLHEARWAATSVPIDSLTCDPVFLDHVDTDNNGRIRTRELKEAIAWLFRFLKNRDHIAEGISVLKLADIDTSHTQGEQLRASAEFILRHCDGHDADEVSLAQVRSVKESIARAPNNGDGIVPPDILTDRALAQFVCSVIDTIGSAHDASGKEGIGEKELDEFFTEARAYLTWKNQGKIPEGKKSTDIMSLGHDTDRLFRLFVDMEEKMDQYFTQCTMVRFDQRTADYMVLRPQELEEINFLSTETLKEKLKEAPLAPPQADRMLCFDEKINPVYQKRVLVLRDHVFKRVFGSTVKQLSQVQWHEVKNTFSPYRAWFENKKGSRVEKLGEEVLNDYLQGAYKAHIEDLVKQDKAVRDKLDQIENVEKLILYQQWLLELTNNFVSFAHLYNPKSRALFEKGTLIIGGREMTFSMVVANKDHHKIIAEKSGIYLMYVEITGRENGDSRFDIVAPVTAGTSDGLRVGKGGIFFTTDGREWDAEIKEIMVNPVSIGESVRAPFEKIADFIRAQIGKFSKSQEDRVAASLGSGTPTSATRDLLLAGSVAIAALGSAFAYMTKAFAQVKVNHILGAFVVIAFFLLLPSIVIGLLRIRKRNLSTILEASGWAINVRMRLTRDLGCLFTHVPQLPKGAQKEKKDTVGKFLRDIGIYPFLSICVLIILLILLALVTVYQLKSFGILTFG